MTHPRTLLRTVLDVAATGQPISDATLGRLRWTDADACNAARTVVDDLAELARSGHRSRVALLHAEAFGDLLPLLDQTHHTGINRKATR